MRGWGRRIGIGAAAGAAALVLAVANAAAAPTGEYAPFGQCPYGTTGVEYCVHEVVEGGSLTLGSKTIPLVNPVTLQGGLSGSGAATQFYAAANGETLAKVAQPVPGGLLGVTAPTWWPAAVQNWWNGGINSGFTGVTATVELAAPASSILFGLEELVFQSGTALGLPVKVKLDNALLGSSCYVGSNAKPIQIDLTTGTDGALSGSAGSLSFNGDFTIITVEEPKQVNATFAAPAASGCGGLYSFLVDPLVNSIFGLPAASTHNSLVLEGQVEVAEAAAVDAHDP